MELFSFPNGSHRLTFAEALDIYWDLHGQFTRGATSSLKYRITLLKKFFGTRFVEDINEVDIENFRRIRIKDGAQKNTINRDHVVLTSMYSKLRRWKKLKTVGIYKSSEWFLPFENPGSLVRKYDERPFIREVLLTESEIKTFMASADIRLRRCILAKVATALRKKDLANLEKKHFNFRSNEVRLFQSKTGHEVKIPINAVLSILHTTAASDKICDFTNHRRLFREALKDSGLEPFRFDTDLRKSVAKILEDKGYPVALIQQLLGHTDSSTTIKYYLPTRNKDLQNAGQYLGITFGPQDVVKTIFHDEKSTEKRGVDTVPVLS